MAEETPLKIDLSPLRTPLQEIPEAIFNRLSREKKGELKAIYQGLDIILPIMVKVSANTWQSIRFLCADTSDGSGRVPELSISVPPLARTILDSLFTTVYLFDNPTENARSYYASGWREAAAYHQRLVLRHGNDLKWKGWLATHKDVYVDGWERDAGITPAEKTHPKTIKWWPNPGKMIRLVRDSGRGQFLRFLDEWYYSYLSGDSHLSLPGLARRGGHLSGYDASAHSQDVLRNYRSSVAADALALFVAFLSEVAAELALDYERDRLKQLWGHLLISEQYKELYAERCKTWFP